MNEERASGTVVVRRGHEAGQPARKTDAGLYDVYDALLQW